ncbi:MAG: Gfo/Idh/MocA family oxidoreductase [Alphaproteobacteria bacterium]
MTDGGVGIGIIGCGNISGAYLKAARHFPILDVRAVADLNMDAARARGAEFGVPAVSVEALLADPAIAIVVNLTIPQAHLSVGLQALDAGKHVHGEKPLCVTLDDGRRLVAHAEARGLRVGCAPDTFLGGAHQTARKLVDEGAIGRPVGGTAFFMCPGHERWHPNPAFYYAKGGGPMLDMGPYYVTDLVNLLGPVARVSGQTSMLRASRPIYSEPLKGQSIDVEVPTHVAGLLTFRNGAIVTIVMSFDVPKHRHLPLEIYGTDATLIVPDPNYFGGQIELARPRAEWEALPTAHGYADDNYRIIGVADMAHAIRGNRPHRASGALALHVLEVMTAIERSAEIGTPVDIESAPERPAMLPVGLSGGALD